MSDYKQRRYWWQSVQNLSLILAACGMTASPLVAQDNTGNQVPANSALEDQGEPQLNDLEFTDEDEDTDDINVTPFMTVDLHVQDTDLADVLKMLSMQSDKNILLSNNVSATVTADLYDVTFYEALDAILHANGYGYREEGKFINVYTREELDAIERSERVTIHKRYELSYLSAKDAAAFVTPLLSDDGSITINGDVEAGIDPDVGNVGGMNWAYSATLLVIDYAEQVDQIGSLLQELDTRPQQVLVEATVLQTKITEDNAMGIDWNVVADADFSDFTNPLSGANDLLTGAFQPDDNKAMAGGSTAGKTGGPGTFKLGIVSNDISVFLRLLDEISDTTVMSRPKVLTLNRQRGEILIGAQIGYLSTTATETSTTQTVEFLDTGTKLIFRPFIARDGFIRLELAPSVSEGLIREVTSSGGDAVTIPDRITQELTTNVLVRTGHTVLLGGLFREDTTLTRSQVPVLGDIPLLGAAFRGNVDSTERQEITFLITPTIMKDEYLDAMGTEAANGVRLARIAARQGTLFFSNDRLTAQHNMRAEDALQQGDYEMALWEVEQSLSLHPDQPEVLRLKEEITSKRDRWFDRQKSKSSMDKAIEAHLGSAAPFPTPNTIQGNPASAEIAAATSTENPIAFDLEDFIADPSTASVPTATTASTNPGTDRTGFELFNSTQETNTTTTASIESTIETASPTDDSYEYVANSELDFVSFDCTFGFNIDPNFTTASLNGSDYWCQSFDAFANEIALTGRPMSPVNQRYSVSPSWLQFQQIIGVDNTDDLEATELAEVSTDTPEGIK